ncbi:hypothetical protein [Sediminispirochaeta smaragdinae]|uniref:Transposase n=1 Tax=Sediminispirochaeta smaragdinae (strain DSM 11293 / JCM 15392 / SEBR 4228) TaxID=573413 RepID=E1R9A9_SEDSS|nr:hypothetical protein [Sediminispirochaeta smaragdinae]ADK83078.1 hypothetical protein Spirs_3993 [Sediminispirochaeta smaragdinae DSM 11293]
MFLPPFCPNPHCLNHFSPKGHWFFRTGSYSTQTSPRIQKFKCKTCHLSFSTRTFSIDYWTHFHLPYTTILSHLVTSSGIRDLSRILKVSCSTVSDRIRRLSHQCLASSASLTSDMNLHEDLVADGFESFVCSQYLPNNIHILAGKDSQFWFLSDYAQLTRKGRMTCYQKKKNRVIKEKLKVYRGSVYQSFQNVVAKVLALTEQSERDRVKLYTDEHTQYKRVMKGLPAEVAGRIEHHRISSKRVRDLCNPLFSVNYLDREIRKDDSDHVRQTVQFARSTVNMLERLEIYRYYHNFMKPYRVGGKDEKRGQTHGVVAGIEGKRIASELRTLYSRRRFFLRNQPMNRSGRELWVRCIPTPLRWVIDYLPSYAWA